MKESSTFFIVAGLCVAGCLAGMGAKHLIKSRPATEKDSGGFASEESKTSIPFILPAISAPAAHSTDTQETLAALDGGELYSRLALWLVDASEEDIAAYWENARKGKRRKQLTELIFINWTRLNPQAAIAAAGTEDGQSAWRAWACHDPQGALAAAISSAPGQVENVVRGLGQFHPGWLREHFNEIPESARGAAFKTLAEWGDSGNPLEMLKFSEKHGMVYDGATFSALFSKDPWTALDWAKETNWDLRELVTKMADESPENLARLAAQSPAGETRRILEAAFFSNLVKTDLEAAIAQATATDTPRIAAERFAAVGLSFVKTDPERALEMAKNLFTVFPHAMQSEHVLRSPDRRSSEGGGALPGVGHLMVQLTSQEPGKVMAILGARPWDKDLNDHAFSFVSNEWAGQDLPAYAEWVGQQSDPVVRKAGTVWALVEFEAKGRYRDGADWAMGLPGENRMSDFSFIFDGWSRKNRAEAREWLDSANLPEDEKRKIQASFSQ